MLQRTIPTPALVLAIVLAAGAAAAKSPLPHRYVAVAVDSGAVRNSGAERATVFAETVEVEGLRGIAAGIAPGGELILETGEGRRLVSAGDATVTRSSPA